MDSTLQTNTGTSVQPPSTSFSEKPGATLGHEQIKAMAETVVGWAAISYAIGYLVIMRHMWHLGLPSPEPVDAVNIWIGSPIALILFMATWYSRKLSNVVHGRIAILRQEIASAKSETKELASKRLDLLDWLFLFLSKLSSFVVFGGLMVECLATIYAKIRSKYRQATVSEIPPILGQAYAKGLQFYLIYSAYNRFIAFIAYSILMCASMWLYVELYSDIPQSLGGGKPVAVNLIVDAGKVPLDAPELRALFNVASTSTSLQEKARTTIRLNLVYSSKDAYFVRSSTNAIVALKADSITGVIW